MMNINSPSSSSYTEADIEYDVDLILDEIDDYCNVYACYTNINMGNYSPNNNNNNNKVRHNNDAVTDIIHRHLKNIRHCKFMKEVLDSEIQKSISGIMTSNETDSIVSQGNTHTIVIQKTMHDELLRSKFSQANKIPLVDIPEVELMITDCSDLDTTLKQLRKDLERDRLLVNSIRVVGATLGLSGIMQLVGDVCNKILLECGIPRLSEGMRDHVVLAVLGKAARSHSGGVAFKAAQTFTDPNRFILIPQSANASPMKVNFQVGAFMELPCHGGIQDALRTQWGLICEIQCESIFKAQSLEELSMHDGLRGSDSHDPSSSMNESPLKFLPVSGLSNAVVGADKGSAKSTYLTVLYEDYVLLPITSSMYKATATLTSGIDSTAVEIDERHISAVIDDWRVTASVQVLAVEPQ